jgi:hypothetical protein
MAVHQQALSELRNLLPLEDQELQQIITYTNALPDQEAAHHLADLLGDSSQAVTFISSYIQSRSELAEKASISSNKLKEGSNTSLDPVPSSSSINRQVQRDCKINLRCRQAIINFSYAVPTRHHTNDIIEAGKVRAKDEVRKAHRSCSIVSNFFSARDAADALKSTIPVRNLQRRR